MYFLIAVPLALCDSVGMNYYDTHDLIQKLPVGDDDALRKISDVLDLLNKRLGEAEATIETLTSHVTGWRPES